jgi:3' exoribonuclease, RNase T-like
MSDVKDIMIDFETLDTGSDCVVISLGACLFDIQKKSIPSTFYMAADVQEQLNKGRKVSADTIRWWMQQEGAAKHVFNEKAKPMDEVLKTFVYWLNSVSQKKERKIWGNGSTFDVSILENLLRMYNFEIPWNYNAVMDLRTFKRFVGKGDQIPKAKVAHHALEDAIVQAQYVIDKCG